MEGKKVSVRKIFKELFGVIFSRDMERIFWPLCAVSGLNWILAIFSQFFSTGLKGDHFGKGVILTVWWIILLILGAWMFLFELRIISEGIDKKDVNWREAVTFANKNLVRSIGMAMILFVLGMLLTVIFGVVGTLIGLGVSVVNPKLAVVISGLFALIGIICLLYISFRLVFAPYHVFLGDRPVITGMVESWQASKERFWLIVRLLLSVLVCVVLLSLIGYGVGVVVGALLSLLHKVIGILVGGIIYVGVQPFILSMMMGSVYLLYRELMVREDLSGREGVGISDTIDSAASGES